MIDIMVLFLTIYVQIMIVAFYLLFRTSWVYKIRINEIWHGDYNSLISYDDMLIEHIFTYDIEKMRMNK